MNRDLLLITGVSSGVGLSLARHLASRYHVIGIARDLDAAKCKLAGVDHLSLYAADLSRPDALDACLARIKDDHGSPGYVINNAGVNVRSRLASLRRDDFSNCMQVNCLAPFCIMQHVLPGMDAAGFGRIVNITSGAPLNCFAEYSAYSASKAALNAMTVTAAREYSGRNIHINLMSPGPVRSKMAPDAPMDPSVCHPTVDFLLDPRPDGPTGRFFWLGYEIPLFPDLDGVAWLQGTAPERFGRVL